MWSAIRSAATSSMSGRARRSPSATRSPPCSTCAAITTPSAACSARRCRSTTGAIRCSRCRRSGRWRSCPTSGRWPIWTVGLFAIFAAIVLAEVEPARRRQALLLLALTPACLINIIGGQNGFLSAALFLGGVLNIDRRPILCRRADRPADVQAAPRHRAAVRAGRARRLARHRQRRRHGARPGRRRRPPSSDWTPGATTSPWSVPTRRELLRQFEGFYTTMMVSVLASARQLGRVLFGRARHPGDRLAVRRSRWPAGPCGASPIRARAPSCW